MRTPTLAVRTVQLDAIRDNDEWWSNYEQINLTVINRNIPSKIEFSLTAAFV